MEYFRINFTEKYFSQVEGFLQCSLVQIVFKDKKVISHAKLKLQKAHTQNFTPSHDGDNNHMFELLFNNDKIKNLTKKQVKKIVKMLTEPLKFSYSEISQKLTDLFGEEISNLKIDLFDKIMKLAKNKQNPSQKQKGAIIEDKDVYDQARGV